MELRVKKYLHDIQSSIRALGEYLGEEPTFETFQNSQMLRRACERELEIIGETMNRIMKITEELPISNARKIVTLRNYVIHQYDDVDIFRIWSIIINDVPILRQEVTNILENV